MYFSLLLISLTFTQTPCSLTQKKDASFLKTPSAEVAIALPGSLQLQSCEPWKGFSDLWIAYINYEDKGKLRELLIVDSKAKEILFQFTVLEEIDATEAHYRKTSTNMIKFTPVFKKSKRGLPEVRIQELQKSWELRSKRSK